MIIISQKLHIIKKFRHENRWGLLTNFMIPDILKNSTSIRKNQIKENTVNRCYLDWAATAIPDDTGINCGIFGNPSSPHTEGRAARDALESARSRCALVLGVSPEKLYFTSGGTESNALVIHSLLRSRGAVSGHWLNTESSGLRKPKGLILYSGIEHPSIRENCLVLERLGLPTGIIGVEKDGRVTEETLSRSLEKYP